MLRTEFSPSSSRGHSSDVDIFNVKAGSWSTAELSRGRGHLAATSLPNEGIVIFAGGEGATCCVCFVVVCLWRELLLKDWSVRWMM
jgi:hypothetical protein